MSVLKRFVVSLPMVAVLGLAACSADEPQISGSPQSDGVPAASSAGPSGTAAPSSGASSSSASSSGAPSAVPSDGTRTLSSSPSATATTPGPGKKVKDERQFVLAAVGAENRPLLTAAPTTSAKGAVRLENKYSDRALWVPTPVQTGGNTYVLKTGKLVFGGETYCLEIDGKKLTIDGCNVGDPDQLFQFPASPRGDGVLMRAGDRYLQWTAGTDQITVGVDAGTSFSMVDRGKAKVPELGD